MRILKEIIYNYLLWVKSIISYGLKRFLIDVLFKYGLTAAIEEYEKFVLFARSLISHAEMITNLSVFLFYRNIQKIHIIALFFLTYIAIMNGSPTADIGGIEPDQAGKVVEGFLSHEKMVDPFAKEYQEFKLQEEPLKQEPPADTRGGFLIFCASAGLFIAVRLYFG